MVEFYAIGPLRIAALADRLIVVEDQFKSGYECKRCDGRGKVICVECGGSGFSPLNPEVTCKTCHKEGLMICGECQGKGGLLITPDVAQRRPTTGKIVSIGPDVKDLNIGDSVLFSNFAGYVIDINDTTLRILHQPELLARIEGHLSIRRGVHEGMDSFDSFNSASIDKGVM